MITFLPTPILPLTRLLGGGWVVPSLVLLIGQHGVGKSRLLKHLAIEEYEGLEEALAYASAEPVVVTGDGATLEWIETANVIFELTRNARKNRLELRCTKNAFARVDPDLFVAFDEFHEKFTLMRSKQMRPRF